MLDAWKQFTKGLWPLEAILRPLFRSWHALRPSRSIAYGSRLSILAACTVNVRTMADIFKPAVPHLLKEGTRRSSSSVRGPSRWLGSYGVQIVSLKVGADLSTQPEMSFFLLCLLFVISTVSIIILVLVKIDIPYDHHILDAHSKMPFLVKTTKFQLVS